MVVKMRLVFVILFVLLQACVDDSPRVEAQIDIINHQFVPKITKLPAGKKIKLIVHNRDSTVEEFESHELRREKIIPPNGQVTVLLAPLRSGKYYFFGEFHEETAQGYLIIEESEEKV